jgi:hypothetical protein
MTWGAGIGIDGTRLALDGRPFVYQGPSSFNAIFQPHLQSGRR